MIKITYTIKAKVIAFFACVFLNDVDLISTSTGTRNLFNLCTCMHTDRVIL